MNSTLFTPSETFLNNINTTIVELWFNPPDILAILCTTVVIIRAMLFLMIILLDKTCWTVPMMLIANSCLSELLCASNLLGIAVFTLQNDLQQIQYQDPLCVFRGYLSCSAGAIQNYSYVLQAIYRYFIVAHPTRLVWQSARTQILLISLTWIFGLLFSIPFIFDVEFTYNVDNQMCQLPLRFSFSLVFVALCVYTIPVSLLIFLYYKLVQYVHRMTNRVTAANTLFRAHRELQLVRRAVIIVTIIFAIGFPYALFVFISFFTTPPKYHFRIAYTFIDTSIALVMITLFHHTDAIKASTKKIINGRPNAVLPILK